MAGKDLLSPYQMALQTAGYFQLDPTLIEKVETAAFAQAGRRPLKTGLVIDKARAVLGYDPVSFEEGLVLMGIKN
jgi:dTDP-4-dehydrorhamnose reductase